MNFFRRGAFACLFAAAAACAGPKVKIMQLETMTPACEELGLITAAGRDKKAIEKDLQRQTRRRGGNALAVTRALTKRPAPTDAAPKRQPPFYEYIGLAYRCAPETWRTVGGGGGGRGREGSVVVAGKHDHRAD